MKALIFTEGGKETGFGHITRCLALRDALKTKGIHARMIVHGDASARRQFPGQLDMIFDWLSQKSRTRELLNGASIVIVDSYLAPIDFYKKISKTAPVCVYIDDFIRLSYPLGILVNGAIDAEKLRYPQKENLRRLLGAKYALLRKDFRQIPKRNARRRIKNVLVTFGGMDRSVFINGMLSYLQPRFPQWHFHIITGQPSHHVFQSTKRVTYYRNITAQKMKQIMLHCDLAISGGGQTTHELAACGVPAAGICFARNQRFNIQGWQRHGFLKDAGLSNDPSIFKNLEASLRQFTLERRCSMGEIGQKLVDGAGASRIAGEIFDSCFSFPKVQTRDRKQIFKWSNAPDARSVSFNTKPIKWSEHCQWFSKKLKDPRCLFFKITWLDRAIGQVRFDRNGKKTSLSVALDRKFRGKGLGGPAIRIAAQHVFKIAPDLDAVDAFVKGNNAVSAKAFLKAGFRLAGTKKIKGQKASRFSKGKA